MVTIHFVHTLYGGVARVAANIINKQLKNGEKVIVAYSEYDSAFNDYIDNEIEFIHINMKNIIGYSMLFGMKVKRTYKYVKDKYPNDFIVVHAHNVQTIGLLSNIKNIPIVCTLHSMAGCENTNRVKISNLIYSMILKKLVFYENSICCVSKALKKDYNKYIKKYDISVVYNGLPLAQMTHKRTNTKFVIGHIGNVSYAKGWDKVYDSYKKINNSNNEYNIEFWSAGKLIDFTKEEISQMNKSVPFKYLGFVNDVYTRVLPKIDLLILPSENEGLPMVVLEAQSLGIPCLVTPVGGMTEIIHDGVNGFIVKNQDEIVDKIKYMIDNEEIYEEMSNNSKIIFENNFSSEMMFKIYEKKYLSFENKERENK